MQNYRFTHRELKQYRTEKALVESKRVDVTNACLVAFRRKNRDLNSENIEIQKVFQKLNKTVRQEEFSEVMKVMNFWLEQDNFTE